MRQLLKLILALTLLNSCSDSFKQVDPTTFNEKIKSRTDINTPEELMGIYYDYPNFEDNPKIIVKTKSLEDNTVEITLTHEDIDDDSQSGQKILMVAKHSGLHWNVTEIKESWKCWDGRGQTSWGTTKCD